jgi:putative sterol carrier protein
MSRTLDTAAVDPAEFARRVARATDEQLAEGMGSVFREEILAEIFGRMERHFRADRAAGVDAVVRFKITGRPDGDADRYEATIRDGRCSVSRELVDKPRVTIQVGAVDFLKLVTGNANGPDLFIRRKIKVKGDLMFAASIAGLFKIPTA